MTLIESRKALEPQIIELASPKTDLHEMKDHKAFKPSKPALPTHLVASVEQPAILFSRMFDSMQDYVSASSEPIEDKQACLGKKISKAKQSLRASEKSIMNTKKSVDTWDGRKTLSNYMFHGVSFLSGVALIYSGQPTAGGSLLVSSLGSTASEIMKKYDVNKTITAATSIASAVIGIGGSIGSGIYQFYRAPLALMNSVTSPLLQQITGFALPITSAITNGFNQFTTIKKNEHLEKLSQIEALHTKTDTAMRQHEQKYQGASKGFGTTVKNFSEHFKTISKAHRRYTDVMRVLTAEFPA